jgi:hypothetical protein
MDASTWVSSLARRVWHAASEMHHATTVASSLMLSYGVAESDQAPDTYAEFILRTPTARRHEPSAARRAAGHPVRLGRSPPGNSGGPGRALRSFGRK